jgi:Domain of unknown function (DUF6249)
MDHIGTAVVGVAFWVYLGVVSVAPMIQEYRKHKAALELLRAAIERGQQLSPEVIDRLMERDKPQESAGIDPRDLRIGGIITCASGLGLMLMSLILIEVIPRYYWVVLGTGVLAVCVGVGLLIAAKSPRR